MQISLRPTPTNKFVISWYLEPTLIKLKQKKIVIQVRSYGNRRACLDLEQILISPIQLTIVLNTQFQALYSPGPELLSSGLFFRFLFCYVWDSNSRTPAHTPMSHTSRASAWGLMAHILFYQRASFSSITVIDLGHNKSLEISIQTSIIFNFDVTQLHRRTNDHPYHQNIQTNCDLAT